MKYIKLNLSNNFYPKIKEILNNYDVEDLELKVPLFSTDSEIYIREVTKYVANKLEEDVIIIIESFEVEALNDFPGLFFKYIEESLGSKNIVKLMNNENKTCIHKLFLSFSEPNRNPIIFKSQVQGKLKSVYLGNDSFYDLFVPNDEIHAYNNEDVYNKNHPIFEILNKFKDFYTKKEEGFEIKIHEFHILNFAPKEGYCRANVITDNNEEISIRIEFDKADSMLENIEYNLIKEMQKKIAINEKNLREEDIKIRLDNVSDDFYLWLKDVYQYSKDLRKTRNPEEYMQKYNEIEDKLIFIEQNVN
jgi:inosine/xanthosine triphosphate pyrophosphatase family protein